MLKNQLTTRRMPVKMDGAFVCFYAENAVTYFSSSAEIDGH